MPVWSSDGFSRRNRLRRRLGAASWFGSGILAAQLLEQTRCRNLPVSHCREQLVERAASHLRASERFELTALQQPAERVLLFAALAFEKIAAELDGPRLLLDTDRVADARARLAGHRELQPVLARELARTHVNFDGVTVVEDVAQRNLFAVDLGARALVAHLAVDRVREIEGGRALGQRDHLAGRGEYEDLVGEQIDLHRVEELVRVRKLALPLEELTQPRELGLVLPVGVETALLVLPMGGRCRARRLRCISAVRICTSMRSP